MEYTSKKFNGFIVAPRDDDKLICVVAFVPVHFLPNCVTITCPKEVLKAQMGMAPLEPTTKSGNNISCNLIQDRDDENDRTASVWASKNGSTIERPRIFERRWLCPLFPVMTW